MLPTSRSKALADTLDRLDALDQGTAGDVRLRLRTDDGSILEGVLSTVSPQELAIQLSDGGAIRRVPASNIATLHVAVPSRPREWMLAVVGIAVGVGALVPVAAVLNMSLRSQAQQVFGVVFVLGTGALSLLLRTPLRAWLTRWELWFSAGNA